MSTSLQHAGPELKEPSTVLVVDDEPDLRELLADALSAQGLEVHTAGDGREAFDLIEKNRYRFVFTDIDMPKMGGIDLISLIKLKHPTLPVAICSARAADYARLLLKLVSPASLLKPFSIEEVAECSRYLTELGRKYRAIANEKPSSFVGEIMAKNVFTLGPKEKAQAAIEGMAGRSIGAVLVVEDAKLLGIFTERDVLAQAARSSRDPWSCALEDVMTRDPVTVPPTMTVDEAMSLLDSKRFRHLPVVEGGRLLGIVSIRDLSRRKVAELSEVAQVQMERLKELQEVLHSKLKAPAAKAA